MGKSIMIIISLLLMTVMLSDAVQQAPPNFKMAVFTSSLVNDIGFNAMINEARIALQREFNTTNIHLYDNIHQNDAFNLMEKLVTEKNYSAIIAGSLEHSKAGVAIRFKYPNIPVFIRGSRASYPNSTASFMTYNIGILHYMMGYFSGLMTKTNILGYVVPGPPLINNYNANTFYLGALEAKKDIGSTDNVTLHLYNTGGWIHEDIEAGATNAILDMGADLIGSTQNDMTVGKVCLERGYMGLGTNGYPQRSVFGEGIGLSFITNWTKVYIKFTEEAIANSSAMGFSLVESFDSGFLSLDNFSTLVPANVRALVLEELYNQSHTPFSAAPYLCNPWNPIVIPAGHANINLNGDCIPSYQIFNLNVTYPGMIYHGFYKVPLVQTYMVKNTVSSAFRIISGLLILLCLVAAAVVVIYKDSRYIRSASPIFCLAILLGGIITYVGVIIWVHKENTTEMCSARYWMLTLGYAIFIGSLVVKNFRIWLIFDNPELKRIRITNFDLLPYVASFILIQVVLLAFLTAPQFGDSRTADKHIEGLGKYEYTRVCEMASTGNHLLIVILATFAALLLVGVFVSWKIRIVDIKEFNESKEIAKTLYAISFCIFVIVPLLVSPQSPESSTIIICSAVLFITTTALALLFIPKFWKIWLHGNEPSSTLSNQTNNLSNNPMTGLSGMESLMVDPEANQFTQSQPKPIEPVITQATFDSDDETPASSPTNEVVSN